MNTFEIGRNRMLFLTAAVLLMLSPLAFGGDWQSFDNTAFQTAKNTEKTIVLDFHADWCPTCRQQKPILEEILREKEFGDVVGFTVDYDSATELKKELNVRQQSTLIVFKGEKEVARSMGLTAKNEIQDFIRKGL